MAPYPPLSACACVLPSASCPRTHLDTQPNCSSLGGVVLAGHGVARWLHPAAALLGPNGSRLKLGHVLATGSWP
eukprot:2939565-Rhodomonas_salina.1